MLSWWLFSKNFGDAINPFLIEKISGECPKNIHFNIKEFFKQLITKEPIYLVVGSTLQWAVTKDTVIWGAGFISNKFKLKTKPRNIFAVRGPLSREVIMDSGIDCPKVYGDPVLLLPKFYQPKIKKKYKLGIIPHHIDKKNQKIGIFRDKENFLIIDICSNIKKVVDDILSCEKIISSALHGIIVSDAYNIPAYWVKFSDKVMGQDFKFKDYYLSIGQDEIKPINITKETTLDQVYENFYDYKISLDLDKLYETCPFKK